MKEQINWKELAIQVGSITENGETSGNQFALKALEVLLGENNLRLAVDYYITGRPGSELARSVLWELRPSSAILYCYDIYKSDLPVEVRRSAVELLRVVADKRAVSWVEEFLKDDDAEIQRWGFGVLDQLLWSYLVEPEEVEFLLHEGETHPNIQVRERAEFIRSFLKDRLSDDDIPDENTEDDIEIE